MPQALYTKIPLVPTMIRIETLLRTSNTPPLTAENFTTLLKQCHEWWRKKTEEILGFTYSADPRSFIESIKCIRIIDHVHTRSRVL